MHLVFLQIIDILKISCCYFSSPGTCEGRNLLANTGGILLKSMSSTCCSLTCCELLQNWLSSHACVLRVPVCFSNILRRPADSPKREEDRYSDHLWCYSHLYLRCWFHVGGVSRQRVPVIWALEWNWNTMFRWMYTSTNDVIQYQKYMSCCSTHLHA